MVILFVALCTVPFLGLALFFSVKTSRGLAKLYPGEAEPKE